MHANHLFFARGGIQHAAVPMKRVAAFAAAKPKSKPQVRNWTERLAAQTVSVRLLKQYLLLVKRL